MTVESTSSPLLTALAELMRFRPVLNYVAVNEFGDDDEIDSYTLALDTASCGGCPANLVLANQTLSGNQTLEATATVTLGPNLIVNGTNIVVNAPIVSILINTSISGPFTIGNTTSCP
jgi:hypothetical protein